MKNYNKIIIINIYRLRQIILIKIYFDFLFLSFSSRKIYDMKNVIIFVICMLYLLITI